MDNQNGCDYCGRTIEINENFGFCDEDNICLCNNCLNINTKPVFKSVFFITGIEIKPLSCYHQTYIDYQMFLSKKNIDDPILRTRTFGWAPTYEMAEEWVLSNSLDISEGESFKWVVIEEIEHGLYIYNPISQIFFQFSGNWDLDGGYYKKLDGWPEKVEDYYNSNYLVKLIADIG